MSFRYYYEELNSQAGIKAYIKKRIFNNLLKELVRQEEEIEKQNIVIKELKKVITDKEQYSKQSLVQNNLIFRELLKIANYESKSVILSDWYYQLTGDTIDFNVHSEMADKILIVEFNSFHGECIPGFYKYLVELNFKVDILVNEELYKEKALDLINCENVYHCNVELMEMLLQYSLIKSYKYVIFNSNTIWRKGKWCTILQAFPFLSNYLNKIYVLEHQLEHLDKVLLEMKHVFVLTDKFPIDKRLIPVNCHWFGNTCLPHKNNITHFLSVGEINPERRNFKMLLEAVEFLYDKRITSFHVTIIGRGNLDIINTRIRSFFSVLGRVSYNTLYSEMRNTDFLLTLLDPHNPDHDRYITLGTSGSFQLIYGFSKPCLIAEKFAEIYGFSLDNAIVYKDNKDLGLAMQKAIDMAEDEYESIRKNLINMSNDIYKKSFENLKSVFK